MELNGNAPKETEYIRKLLFEFNKPGTLGRVWKKVTRSDKKYTRTDIARFLSNENDDYAYQFISKLEENQVLEQVGKRKTASKPVPLFKFHRRKLLDAFTQTEYYQEEKKLFLKALDYSREGLDLT